GTEPNRRPGRRARRTSSGSVPRFTRRGRPLATPAPTRNRLGTIRRDLSRRYLPEGDLRAGETALAKIVAETEDPFKVLISTILSQRTRDEMTEVASRQLFSKYDTPAELAAADAGDVERLIKPVGFYHQKAVQIVKVSRTLLDRHAGSVPRTYEELIELPQVGPKTANCVLVYGFGVPRIPTDTHVHRVSNRLGLVRTKTPEATERRLMRTVPEEYWLHINELFIRFGKDLCRPIGPRCPQCSFTPFCRFYPKTKWSRNARRRGRKPRDAEPDCTLISLPVGVRSDANRLPRVRGDGPSAEGAVHDCERVFDRGPERDGRRAFRLSLGQRQRRSDGCDR